MASRREARTTVMRAAPTLAALLLLCAIDPAGGAVRKLHTSETRDFGYVIGDLVEREIHLQLDAPYRLQTDNLPDPGVANLWLRREPIAVQHQDKGAYVVYDLTLVHQIIGVPAEMATIFVPELTLTISDGGQSLSLPIPARPITVSPITPGASADDARYITPQPDARPLAAPLVPTVQRLVLLGLGLLLAVVYFVYAFATLPWIARSNGPFARAHKTLRALATSGVDAGSYGQALRSLHRAFNQTAGKAVFAEGLSEFFRSRPEFGRLQAPIEDFFTHSQETFFTGANTERQPMSALLQLCRSCRDVERGLA